jgi:PAS domain S-box-containing protein
MTGFFYTEWRNYWLRSHFVAAIHAAAITFVLFSIVEADAAGVASEPISQKLYDHPLLFLCIIFLLSILVVVLLLSRRKLQSSERRYRSLFEDNGAIMLLIEPASMRIMDANPAACAFYRWSPADFLNMRVTDITTLPEAKVREIYRDILNHERRQFHTRHRLASGEERNVEVNSMPYRVDGVVCLLCIIHDITERQG